MELRNLKTFVRAYELGSFSKAAEDLGYTQSAVTIQIKQLEKELGVNLFERIGKRVHITHEGLRFKEYAVDMLAKEQEALNVIGNEEIIKGNLRIGTAESISNYLMPEIIQRFHARCPEVTLSIHNIDSDTMYSAVYENKIDYLLFMEEPVLKREMTVCASKPFRMAFVTGEKNASYLNKKMTLEDIVALPLILTETGLSYRDELDRMVMREGLSLNPIMEIESITLLLKLLLQGEYVTYLPEFVVHGAEQSDALRTLNCNLDSQMHLQLVHHKDKIITPQMRVFAEIVAAVMEGALS